MSTIARMENNEIKKLYIYIYIYSKIYNKCIIINIINLK